MLDGRHASHAPLPRPWQVDTDGDGKISTAELRAYVARVEAHGNVQQTQFDEAIKAARAELSAHQKTLREVNNATSALRTGGAATVAFAGKAKAKGRARSKSPKGSPRSSPRFRRGGGGGGGEQ